MNRKFVTITAIVILVVFALVCIISFIPFRAFASSQSEIQKKLDAAKKERNQVQTQINAIEEDRKEGLEKKKQIDAEVYNMQSQVDMLESEIQQSQERIKVAQKNLQEAQKKEQNQSNTFKNRVRVMYEQGSASYVEILFSAKSFGDLIGKLEAIKEIATFDRAVLAEMQENTAKISENKKILEDEKAAQELRRVDKEKQLSALSVKQKEQENFIASLEGKKDELVKMFEDFEKEEAALKRELSSISSRSSTPNVTFTSGEFTWPVPSCMSTTSAYGMRVHPVTGKVKMHNGEDIPASFGATVVAAKGGKVIKAASGYNGGFGNYIVIDHGGGKSTLYAHLSYIGVSSGDSVEKGQTIGKVGSTGLSTGPHLHFEVLVNGSPTDPKSYFN